MATAQTIVDRIFDRMRPADYIEVSIPQVLSFINQAAEVARGSGWVLHMEDDESLTFAENTWEYAVPATFAYVESLRIEDDTTSPSTYDEHIPRSYWEIRINAAVPYFYINQRAFPIPVDKSLKVIGQKRPSLYTVITATVDPGMEAYLTEMASHFALSFMSAGNPTLELDRSRLALAQKSLGFAEALLSRHPAEFRVRPSSRLVPGR